jgi:ABC-type methionine transport system ATPase subunit
LEGQIAVLADPVSDAWSESQLSLTPSTPDATISPPADFNLSLLYCSAPTWEVAMSDDTYQLIYPSTLLRRPILNQLIRQFELTANIIEANITLEEGWLKVQLTGEDEEVEEALKWLSDQGIEVKRFD